MSPSLPDGSNAHLHRWVQARDEAALAGLIAWHRPMVAAVARRILDHELDAEEVTDEVMADLAKDAGAIRGQPGAWLRQAATYRSLRRKRRCQSAPQALDGRESVAPDLHGDAGDATRRQAEVARALSSLDEVERRTVIQHYYHGRTTADIASLVGITAQAVRRKLIAALDRLRRQEPIRQLYAEVC